jgi:hypothetical protein
VKETVKNKERSALNLKKNIERGRSRSLEQKATDTSNLKISGRKNAPSSKGRAKGEH